MNTIRHGLRARSVLLPGESEIRHPKSIKSCIMHLKENQTMSKGMDRKKETKKPKKKKP